MNLPRRRFLHVAAGAAALPAMSRISPGLASWLVVSLENGPALAAVTSEEYKVMRSRHHGRVAVERRGSPLHPFVVGPDLSEIDGPSLSPMVGSDCPQEGPLGRVLIKSSGSASV